MGLPGLGREAGTKALADAGIPYDGVEQAFVGYCYGESTSGQRAVYGLGLTGIPVVNVNNNCSTGSSALYMARQAVRGGLADCALALGFEKMEKGSLGVKYTDRTNPIDKHVMTMFEVREPEQSPFAPQMFGNAGREHMERYGSEPDHYAWIGWKNHKHSVNNPYAQFQDEYSLDDIKAAKMIHEPLTKLQCSPTSDGSRLRDRRQRAASSTSTTCGTARSRSRARRWSPTCPPRSRSAARSRSSATTCPRRRPTRPTRRPGVGPDDVDVIELHDCFSANELITYEALGLAEEGEGHELVDDEDTTYGGRWVVNPSGGLISKGHPLGATGLAQCSELTWQLRGDADKRQVDGAKVGSSTTSGWAARPSCRSTSPPLNRRRRAALRRPSCCSVSATPYGITS